MLCLAAENYVRYGSVNAPLMCHDRRGPEDAQDSTTWIDALKPLKQRERAQSILRRDSRRFPTSVEEESLCNCLFARIATQVFIAMPTRVTRNLLNLQHHSSVTHKPNMPNTYKRLEEHDDI